MVVEDVLKEIIEKLELILEENKDIADESWMRLVEKAKRYLKKALKGLE